MNKSKEPITSAILVELDALLDTRLALIAEYSTACLSAVLKANTYHTRLADSYPGLTIEAFQERYHRRQKSVLKHAIITPVADLVKSFVYRTLKQALNSPFHYQPKIIVNTYPYQLTEAETTLIIHSLIGLTDQVADVEAVYASYDEIDPAYVKQHLSVMVLYDYTRWLDVHSVAGRFNKVTCPEVGLVAPQLYFKEYDTKADHAAVFQSMEQLAQPFIALQLLPVKYFSILFTKP